MDGAMEVAFLRRFAQRQGQTTRSQGANLRLPPCKNRPAPVVPDQDRQGGAGPAGDVGDVGAIGFGQGVQTTEGGGDGPAGRAGGDLVAPVPDGWDAGLQRDVGWRATPKLAGLPPDQDRVAVSLDAGAGEGGGEVFARVDAGCQGFEPVAARRRVVARGSQKQGRQTVRRHRPLHLETLSQRERA